MKIWFLFKIHRRGVGARCPQCNKRIEKRTDIFPSYGTSNDQVDRSIEISELSKALDTLNNGLIQGNIYAVGSVSLAVEKVLATFKNKDNEGDAVKEAKNNLTKNFIELSENVLQLNKEWEMIEKSSNQQLEELNQKDRELDAWQKESARMESVILKLKKKCMKKKCLKKKCMKKKQKKI